MSVGDRTNWLAVASAVAWLSPALLATGVARVDAHVHLWSLPRADGSTFPIGCCGDLEYLSKDFVLEEHPLVAASDVREVVLIESLVGVAQEKEEEANRALIQEAAADTRILAVVGRLDLRSSTFEAKLQRLSRAPVFRGLRMGREIFDSAGGPDPVVVAALETVAARGLLIESHRWTAAEAALILPDVPAGMTVVLDHFAAGSGDAGLDEAWREGVRALRPFPNVVIKISNALRFSRNGRGNEPVEEALRFLLAELGPERLIFGSDWPVSERWGSVSEQVAIVESVVGGLDPEAVSLIFGGNARRVYGPREPSRETSP